MVCGVFGEGAFIPRTCKQELAGDTPPPQADDYANAEGRPGAAFDGESMSAAGYNT
jgi:hypothetical protein